MKVKIAFQTVVLWLGLAATYGQGTFQNLNFESATLVPVPGDPLGRVEFGPAFQGWTGYIGGQVQSTTLPNGVPIGSPGEIPPFIAIMVPPLWNAAQGHYELGFGGSQSLTPVALAQTGRVPIGALSLQYLAVYAPDVFLNGQALASVPLGSGPSTRTLFGVDISAYAGQVLELRFQPRFGINYLDDIQFSNQPIPEPSPVALLGLGALLLGWRRRNYPNP